MIQMVYAVCVVENDLATAGSHHQFAQSAVKTTSGGVPDLTSIRYTVRYLLQLRR